MELEQVYIGSLEEIVVDIEDVVDGLQFNIQDKEYRNYEMAYFLIEAPYQKQEKPEFRIEGPTNSNREKPEKTTA